MINGTKSTTFDEPSFYLAIDSYYYLLLGSDILENTVDLIHKNIGGIYALLYIVNTKKILQ